MNRNFYSLLRDSFARRAPRVAVQPERGEPWTFASLDRAAARCAALLSELGLAKGDRVAVQVEKSPQALALYLGCLRAGLVYLPLNTAYQRAEIGYFLADAEPGAVVCASAAQPGMRALLDEAGSRAAILTLDADGSGTLATRAAGCADDFAAATLADSDLAAIIYTSGTTGRSKGAMVTHGNLVSNAQALVQCWGFSDSDVLLHALPMFHIHGLFVANHCALLSGARMLFHAGFDAAAVMRDLPRATVFMGVPTFYSRLLAAPAFGREACAAIRLFVSGSAPLLPDVFETFRQRTGQAILERYGMSEAGMITSNPLRGERRPGTVGMPLPGVSVRVADERDSVLPAGQTGGIQVRGPNVFAGYWRMPEKTREEFTADGWFRTGDLGAFDADGYLAILGRAKDLIISGGYNVYPKEIELVIDALPGVAESAVIGLPHPDFGEAVTAVVVRKAGATDPDEAAVIGHVKGQLANYKVPKRVFFVDDLPRNAMGKVQKNLLRAQYAAPRT